MKGYWQDDKTIYEISKQKIGDKYAFKNQNLFGSEKLEP